jgi:hypothetical protein
MNSHALSHRTPIRHSSFHPPLAFPFTSPTLRALMEKSNKAVLTDLSAFDIDSLKERLTALRRFL